MLRRYISALMIAHDLHLAARRLLRHPGHSALHLIGLSVGLACVLLIGLFVRDELSYDRFHPDADRIVRLSAEGTFANGSIFEMGGLPPGAAAFMTETLPEVEAVTLTGDPFEMTIHTGGERMVEGGFIYADEHFFDVFGFELIAGDTSALSREDGVLITPSLARRVFGDADPMGQMLMTGAESGLEVVGIVADPPEQSHLQFSALMPRQPSDRWYVGGSGMYARLGAMADTATVIPAVESELLDRLADQGAAGFAVEAVPLTRLYLHTAPYSATYTSGAGLLRGKAAYVWAFGIAALLVLLVSCISYVTLATAQAAGRIREVGVRRAVGAGGGQIVRQFLAETAVLTAAALTVGMALAYLALPALNALTDKALRIETADPFVWLLFLGVGLIVTLLCGLYPALGLAGVRPTRALAGRVTVGRGAWIRRGLVAGQFAISAGLLLCALTMERQLDFVGQQSLGFAGDQLVRLERMRAAQYDALKADLLSISGVLGVTSGPMLPNGLSGSATLDVIRGDTAAKQMFGLMKTDADFATAFGTTMIAGRYLDAARPADSSAVVLTELSAQVLGWNASEAVGQTLQNGQSVVGVMSDLVTASQKVEAKPSLFVLDDGRARVPYLRVDPARAPEVLAAAQARFLQSEPNRAFEYAFMDEAFASFFEADRRLRVLIGTFTAVALLLALLGVVGLAAQAGQQRRREIGIRKALGAGVGELVVRLAREFGVLALAGLVVAAPVAYLLMQRWLSDFPTRIDLGPSALVPSALIVIGGALFVAMAQSWRAATVSPADVLRDE